MAANVGELMKLLAVMTRWSNQTLSVDVSYMPARMYVGEDDSYLDNQDWGFRSPPPSAGRRA